MTIKLEPCIEVGVGDTEVVGINALDWLRSGELLTGTPTVVEQTTSVLTLGDKAVNTAAVVIKGESCAAGQAVVFSVSGGLANTTYVVRVTCSSDATVARTWERDLEISWQ